MATWVYEGCVATLDVNLRVTLSLRYCFQHARSLDRNTVEAFYFNHVIASNTHVAWSEMNTSSGHFTSTRSTLLLATRT